MFLTNLFINHSDLKREACLLSQTLMLNPLPEPDSIEAWASARAVARPGSGCSQGQDQAVARPGPDCSEARARL